MQVVEESVADDDMVMIRGSSNTAAVSVLLRGANDYMLDEMDRSLHDAFCVVKRVLESGKVVPGGASHPADHLRHALAGLPRPEEGYGRVVTRLTWCPDSTCRHTTHSYRGRMQRFDTP